MFIRLSARCLSYRVNLSKRGGKDWVFQGLAGLLQGKSREAALPAVSTLSFPILLLRFTFYFQHGLTKYKGRQANILFLIAFSADFWWQIANSDTTFFSHKFVVQNTFVFNYFVEGPLWKVENSSQRLWQVLEQVISWKPCWIPCLK